MAVCDTFFKKKKARYLFIYESGPSKTQVDYCLIKRNQRKFLKDIKLLPG